MLENTLNINQLKTAATVDPLTNCYNRRVLDSLITSDIFYARRYSAALSVIMIDVDNCKKINDVHGHYAGDAVLKDIRTLLPSLVRKSDYLARCGGEVFVLVLPDTTLYNAIRLAEKLRKKIEMHETRLSDKSIRVTASFGVARFENKPDGGSLLREADERLFKAKAIGKNCVVPHLLPAELLCRETVRTNTQMPSGGIVRKNYPTVTKTSLNCFHQTSRGSCHVPLLL